MFLSNDDHELVPLLSVLKSFLTLGDVRSVRVKGLDASRLFRGKWP
jgi:hypothetical protein